MKSVVVGPLGSFGLGRLLWSLVWCGALPLHLLITFKVIASVLMKMSFIVGKVVAPIGATMAIMALLTGAIWGKPTWGTWWVWDARLTSMLILLFLYFGVIAIYNAIENEEMANKAAAILSIVGSINIPIIKYSVEWWNTLHQPATITLTKKPTMAPEMFIPLAMTRLAFYCWFAVWVFARTRNEILWRERRTNWVKKELNLLESK